MRSIGLVPSPMRFPSLMRLVFASVQTEPPVRDLCAILRRIVCRTEPRPRRLYVILYAILYVRFTQGLDASTQGLDASTLPWSDSMLRQRKG